MHIKLPLVYLSFLSLLLAGCGSNSRNNFTRAISDGVDLARDASNAVAKDAQDKYKTAKETGERVADIVSDPKNIFKHTELVQISDFKHDGKPAYSIAFPLRLISTQDDWLKGYLTKLVNQHGYDINGRKIKLPQTAAIEQDNNAPMPNILPPMASAATPNPMDRPSWYYAPAECKNGLFYLKTDQPTIKFDMGSWRGTILISIFDSLIAEKTKLDAQKFKRDLVTP